MHRFEEKNAGGTLTIGEIVWIYYRRKLSPDIVDGMLACKILGFTPQGTVRVRSLDKETTLEMNPMDLYKDKEI